MSESCRRLNHAIVCVLLAWNAPAAGQSARLVGEGRRQSERIMEAGELARAGHFDAALDAYLKLRDDSANALVADAGQPVERPVRRIVDERIQSMPELRERFRRRFEARAAKMAAEAISGRNVVALRQVVDEFGPCVAAATAWDALGDLAFERGEFALARHAWRMSKRVPGTDQPLPFAKILLAGLYLGETTKKDLEDFASQHPSATGHLAGRNGLLIDALRVTAGSLAEAPMRSVVPNAARTFAGNAARQGVIGAGATLISPRQSLKSWRWPTAVTSSPDKPVQKRLIAPRQLVAHAMIWRGHAVISNGRRIAALNLSQMRAADIFDIGQVGAAEDDNPSDEPHTLTIDGERVIARLGGDLGHVVALAANSESDGNLRWKLEWHVSAATLPEADGAAALEGSPVVSDGRLFVSWVRTTANRVTQFAGCWSVDRLAEGPRWVRAIAEWPSAPDVRPRRRLLTVAGPNLICGTDAGLIVAADTESGVLRWAARYASRGPRPLTNQLLPSPRDVCPAVACNGRLFVAPADCAEVVCLDQWTGASLWRNPPTLDVVQLLGVTGGRLIVTADGVLRGIGAIDVVTGRVDPSWGDLSSVPPFGRGLVLADRVLFPTRDGGIKVLGLDGRPNYPSAAFQAVAGGNLAIGDGWLVVAGPDDVRTLDCRGDAGEVQIGSDPLPSRTVPTLLPSEPAAALPSDLTLDPCWRLNLPEGEVPLQVAAGRLMTARDRRLVSRTLPEGDEKASLELPFVPNWVSRDKPNVVAGADGMACVDLMAERLVWRLSAQSLAPPAKSWSGFVVDAGRCVACLGSDRFVGIDIANGKLAWDYSSPVVPFQTWTCVGGCLIGQTAGNRAVLLDIKTGRVGRPLPAPPAPWPVAPVTLPGNGLVVVTDDRALSAVNPQSEKQLWNLKLPIASDPAMSQPIPVEYRGGLLLARTSALRSTITRVNAESGRLTETEWVFSTPACRIDGQALAVHADVIVSVAGRTACAADFVKRTPLWSVALPDGPGWRVFAVGGSRVVLAMKAAAWAWCDNRTYSHRWSARLIELKTGEVVGQLDVPTRGPTVVFGGTNQRWVVALDGCVLGFESNREEK